jgi:hypothetical protein
MQLIVNAPQHTSAFQLKRRDAKSHQHGHENEPIPDLQTPADGFENHDWGNIQHSTSNIENPKNGGGALSMLGVEC